MERAVTSSSALRGSMSGKKRNKTPINGGNPNKAPKHGKIRRVKTSEGGNHGKRTKRAKREEHIG